MKKTYRGFEINLERGESQSKYVQTYYLVSRISDGFTIADGFTEGEDTVQTLVQSMKDIVDDYFKNPMEANLI